MKFLKYGLLLIPVFLVACAHHERGNLDEKQGRARQLAQKILTNEAPSKISPLKGGMSDSSLYKVSTDKRAIVIRFIDHRSSEDRHREVDAQNKAGRYGYGPKVYYSDVSEGVIAMDFLESQPITLEIRRSPSFYRALGRLVKSIHEGDEFKKSSSIFKQINKKIKVLNWKLYKSIDKNIIKNLLVPILKYQSSYSQLLPTHNDLNPNNILLSGNHLYAIDYENASLGDPFFDLATIGIFYLFDEKSTHLFLKSYFGRSPTPREMAKFHLMKVVSLVYYGLAILSKVPEDHGGEQFSRYPLRKAFELLSENKIDLESISGKMTLVHSLIDAAILISNSKEFKEALKILEEEDGIKK